MLPVQNTQGNLSKNSFGGHLAKGSQGQAKGQPQDDEQERKASTPLERQQKQALTYFITELQAGQAVHCDGYTVKSTCTSSPASCPIHLDASYVALCAQEDIRSFMASEMIIPVFPACLHEHAQEHNDDVSGVFPVGQAIILSVCEGYGTVS